MIAARDITRFNTETMVRGVCLPIRIVTVRLWEADDTTAECDRFNIQVKVQNDAAARLVPEEWLETGTWTCVCHSDHNPTDGHDIRSNGDSKGAHIDVHPHKTARGYATVLGHLFDGSPPASNNAVIQYIEHYIRTNMNELTITFLTDGGRRSLSKSS